MQMKPMLSRIISAQTPMSAFSDVENGGTWYQNEYSQSHGWPG